MHFRYYIEVAFKERRGPASCHVAALMLNTDYSHSQSDYIIDEQQIISIRTNHHDEVKVGLLTDCNYRPLFG